MSGGKGGSSSSGTSSNYGSSTTTLPDWLSAGSQEAVSTAEQLANRPYDPYSGQLVASQSPDTLQAYQQIRGLQGMTDPAFNAASGAWGGVLGNLQSLTPDQLQATTNALYGGYTGNVVAPSAGLLSGYMAQGPATAGQVAANTQQMMSPYAASVIAPALQLGQQQLASNLQNIGASANQAGAFGGSRQGVMEGVAQAQAALQAAQLGGNLLQQGWNTALTPATQVAMQGGQQGYGAAGLLAGQLGQGYTGQQAQAANIMQQNLGLGTQAAQQIPALAQAQSAQALKDAQALSQAGAAQQNQAQTELNAQYQMWQQAQNWPTQNLDILLSALGSVPYGSTQTGWNIGNQSGTSSNWSTNTGGLLGSVGTIAGLALV